MARVNRTGITGSNRRRVKQRDNDSEESDEEYKVTEDEDFNESDEDYSLDGDEPEEILAEFKESERVFRSRNTRRTSLGRKGGTIKTRKKRRVCYTMDDDEEEEVDEEDDMEVLSSGSKTNRTKMPREKKKVSYKVFDEEEEDTRMTSLGRKGEMIKPRKKTRVCYDDDDDDDKEEEEEEEEEEVDEEDDTEFVPLGKVNHIKKSREKKKVSYKEVDDEEDEDYAEFVSPCRKRNQRKKPREKKRILHTDEDEDLAATYDDADDEEFMYSDRVANQKKRLREKRKVSYTEDDEEDDYVFISTSRKENQIHGPPENKIVSYKEENEDKEDEKDAEFKLSESDFVDDEDASPTMNKNEEVMASYDEDGEEKEDEKDAEFKFSESDFVDDEDASPTIKKNEEVMVSNEEDDEEKEDEEDSEFKLSESEFVDDEDASPTMNKNEELMVSYKDDDEEKEDEEDAEFKLSESDFVDDEDTSPTMKKKEKASRRHPLKKSIRSGQKKSKKSKVKKPASLKQRSHSYGHKQSSSKQRPAANKKQVEIRGKKTSKRRKQRVTASSDSDFAASASPDHDYTISEEEREQMREAGVYCTNLRAKLDGKQEEPICAQRKYPVRKGKEKVEDLKDEPGKQVCGICLSEEGKRTVRGVLNCCRHHFCFSCIMEWSKVESRCPICKQRFATIMKAAKSDAGSDVRTVIPVPECDQVYQPSEEELRGYLDPYESVICTECHNGGDDALMLLCDICDSPAHTFCVGLGREVPEGNWYCEGCRPTVYGSLSSQRPTATSDRILSSNASNQSSPIPGGFDLNELYVPESPVMQQTRFLPEHRLPVGDFNHVTPAPTGTVATTLRDRRRMHFQIRHRFLNNNRMNYLVSRSSGTSSSSGIRLFGSQLDQARVSTPERAAYHHEPFNGGEDPSMYSLHDNPSVFSPRMDRISEIRVQNPNLASVYGPLQGENDGFDSRLGYAQLRPCTNSRSSIGADASPSSYACREVVGSSRRSQGGLHAP